jgi:hypothetical protein
MTKKGNIPKKIDETDKPVKQEDRDLSLLKETFGSRHNSYINAQLRQVSQAMPPDQSGEDSVKNIMILLTAIKPQNELEGLIASQLIATHNLSMQMLAKAAVTNRTDFGDRFVNQSTKLSRTFVALLEALNKHRGKGKQKITVEHVTVNDGGQAVVGNVQGGECGHKK